MQSVLWPNGERDGVIVLFACGWLLTTVAPEPALNAHEAVRNILPHIPLRTKTLRKNSSLPIALHEDVRLLVWRAVLGFDRIVRLPRIVR